MNFCQKCHFSGHFRLFKKILKKPLQEVKKYGILHIPPNFKQNWAGSVFHEKLLKLQFRRNDFYREIGFENWYQNQL